MALTRKFLSGLGLTEEQSQAIIEAHTETTDALKDQRDKYKEDAEKLPVVQKELDELKENSNEDEWKEKYAKEHADFEAFKEDLKQKELNATKEKLYRELLKTVGVADKSIESIINVTQFQELEIDKDGKLKDVDDLTKTINEKYSGFITTTETEGAATKTPPETGGTSVSQEEFNKMGYNARNELFHRDRETYDRLSGANKE